ncbi:hypothetical protein SeLEV6574_g03078 [Synchytrium endobioticum]|uniref:K Homology domain-containing protein n=1 Tax=Synchytrium endobioticum TaxID=286115 RepID=A0A507D5I9_9FUNG|nr:hypothetical protein SeLEV6574_g03078 [Synchytrium endobioticum]
MYIMVCPRLQSPESPDRKRALDDDDQEHHLDETERERKRQATESTTLHQTGPKSQEEGDDEPSRDATVDSNLAVPPSSMEEDGRSSTLANPPLPLSDAASDQETAPQATESACLPTPPLTTIAPCTMDDSNDNVNSTSNDNTSSNDCRMYYSTLTMRALVTTREAGIIIGKSGRHVKEIRQAAGAGISVSEQIPSAPDRVLSITGKLDNIGKAFALIATKMAQDQSLLEGNNNPTLEMLAMRPIMIRLLVPAARIGPIIGRNGSKIREIQERSVEGVIDAIHIATYHIGTIIAKDQASNSSGPSVYTALPRMYTSKPSHMNHSQQNPQPVPYYMPFHTPMPSPYVSPGGGYSPFSSMTPPPQSGPAMSSPPSNNVVSSMAPLPYPYPYPGGPIPSSTGNAVPVHMPPPNANGYFVPLPSPLVPHIPQNHHQIPHMTNLPHSHPHHHNHSYNISPQHHPNHRHHHASPFQQQIVIPSDLVGCIIGRGGSKISEMRQASGCQIKVSDRPNEGGQRLLTVIGTPDAVYSALYMIHSKLDAEKQRLAQHQQHQQRVGKNGEDACQSAQHAQTVQ